MPLPETLAIEQAAVLVVFVGILMRLYLGHALFHPKYTLVWNTIRRTLVPILQTLVYAKVPFDVKIENESKAYEYAATVSITPKQLAKAIDDVRDVEVPLLAGFKNSPDGKTESGTFVWYHGPKPGLPLSVVHAYRHLLPAFIRNNVAIPATWPHWLRKYQTHPTTFTDDDGNERVYVHTEANSYRPDLWADHLFKGPSYSAEEGIHRFHNAMEDAGVEPVEAVETPTEA